VCAKVVIRRIGVIIMASVLSEKEEEERQEAIELLRNQIKTEGRLISEYKDFGANVVNVPVRRMLHMIMYDSYKHIEALQAAIDIIERKEVLKDDRKELREGLKRHLELEKESLKKAEKVLNYRWVKNIKGLNELIKGWRDEEKRHHQTLKNLSNKPFIEIDKDDWMAIFGSEEFFEERYLRSKRYQEKLKK
jgi:hypothetical protein